LLGGPRASRDLSSTSRQGTYTRDKTQGGGHDLVGLPSEELTGPDIGSLLEVLRVPRVHAIRNPQVVTHSK
jgi:hypothetical protein